jgi:hypothetical protein
VQTNQLEMFAPSIGLGGTFERPAINREIVVIAREAKQTSVDAALKVKPKTGKKRARVHAYLMGRPATDEEIETALNMSGNTVRPTRGTLVKDGHVIDSGIRRLTRAGNEAIVWRCV